MEMKVLRRMAK